MIFFSYLILFAIGAYLTAKIILPEWNKPLPKKVQEPSRTSVKKFLSINQNNLNVSSDVKAIEEYILRLEKDKKQTIQSIEDIFLTIDAPQIQQGFYTYRKTKEDAIRDLTEKCQKLEMLLDERTKELKRFEIDSTNEYRNREEFQKVRDLLEKQLQEIKEKNKILQNQNIELQKQNETLKDQFSTKAIF